MTDAIGGITLAVLIVCGLHYAFCPRRGAGRFPRWLSQ